MSSSTSSSDRSPRARGLRVGLLVAAALLLIELGARLSVLPGTADLSRYGSFAARARALVASPDPSIVFVGNSVTDRVRLDLVRQEWQALTGKSPKIDKFVAYYSNLETWYRISEHYFWKQGLKPDLIVVTYYEGNGLADSPSQDIGNLAQYFTGPEDRARLFAQDLRTLSERFDYLLSSFSEAYGARDRIRVAVLNAIPGYRPFATETNAVNFEHEKLRNTHATGPVKTFRTLGNFLEQARAAGVTVCFVASPSKPRDGRPAPYVISPLARKMIADAGMLHLDLRRMDGLTADMYKDNVHVNARGVPVYTKKLVLALHQAWKPQ
jgi:hypothetical protein